MSESLLSVLGAARDLTSWLDTLLPASWRGIEFAVERSETRRGRRTAVHEYPFRNTVWVEDLGRGVRSYAFTGFVVGDDCYEREQALLEASETPGSGVLIHPTLGTLTVALVGPLVTEQEAERGRCVSLRFEFVETSDALYPTSSSDTQSLVASCITSLFGQAGSDFVSGVSDALTEGAEVLSSAVSTANDWVAAVVPLASDAGIIASAVAGLSGNYGRYSTGNRNSYFSDITTTDEAIAAVVDARAKVQTAAGTVVTASKNLTDGGSSLCSAASELTEALRACCNDPADALRLLMSLCEWVPATIASSAPIGGAIQTMQTCMGQLFRRVALASLAQACADYQPSSYDDAITVRGTVVTIYDAAVLDAGDAGQDQAYLGLRALRTSVALDLTERGASLARLMTVETPLPMPANVLAYRLYGDATRADDLVARANPVHPAFMPTRFRALSS